MRDSVGGTWLIGLIVTFTLIFVGYLTIMINYSTAFKTKNEVVSIIEKYEGISDAEGGSIKIINQYLKNAGYTAVGNCSEGWYGVNDLDNFTKLQHHQKGSYYCVRPNGDSKTGYYDVHLFLYFDVPVIGQLGNLRVNGQTNKIKYMATDGLSGYK